MPYNLLTKAGTSRREYNHNIRRKKDQLLSHIQTHGTKSRGGESTIRINFGGKQLCLDDETGYKHLVHSTPHLWSENRGVLHDFTTFIFQRTMLLQLAGVLYAFASIPKSVSCFLFSVSVGVEMSNVNFQIHYSIMKSNRTISHISVLLVVVDLAVGTTVVPLILPTVQSGTGDRETAKYTLSSTLRHPRITIHEQQMQEPKVNI